MMLIGGLLLRAKPLKRLEAHGDTNLTLRSSERLLAGWPHFP
jgi:hypothetical protein